jgi:hypothetical protein
MVSNPDCQVSGPERLQFGDRMEDRQSCLSIARASNTRTGRIACPPPQRRMDFGLCDSGRRTYDMLVEVQKRQRRAAAGIASRQSGQVLIAGAEAGLRNHLVSRNTTQAMMTKSRMAPSR